MTSTAKPERKYELNCIRCRKWIAVTPQEERLVLTRNLIWLCKMCRETGLEKGNS